MKHKEKQKHLERRHLNRTERSSGASNPEETAPQPQSAVEAPACSQAAGAKSSSSSEYFTCVSSQSKLRCPDQDGTYQLHGNVNSLESLEMLVPRPIKKRRRWEGHRGGPYNTQEDAPQHQSPVEAQACIQEAGGDPSPSEYFTCVSSPSDVDGLCNIQEDVPQHQSPVEAPARSQATAVNSFTSEYSSFVCSPSKLSSPDEDGLLEIYVSQDLKQKKNSLDTSHTHIPSHSVNNNEPYKSSVQGTDLRLRTIYYTHVQLKRGVTVFCHTEEGLEPPSKKIKMEEMTYIEKVHENVFVSHMSEKKSPIDHEHNLESRAQEKGEEADSTAQPPALDGYPSNNTPEWPMAPDSGFRCMACCRVFPSLEVLQEHVEYGVREGFSCHAFHNAMARLKYKDRKEDEQEDQGGNM